MEVDAAIGDTAFLEQDVVGGDAVVEAAMQLVAAGEDVWLECGRRDDLTSVALYYLDRPNGDHALCPKEDRCVPFWRWPAPDAAQLLETDAIPSAGEQTPSAR